MRVLVVVASKHGSTYEIAAAIAEELRAAQFTVDLHDLQAEGALGDLAGYHAVVLGSAIYAGSWLPAARAFAAQHHAALTRLPIWVFSSGPLGADNPQPRDDPARLAASLGVAEIQDQQVFVGKLDPATLDLGERLIAAVVNAPAGDFRDWGAIRGWAREIAAALRVENAAPVC